jgi:hypothetical protein
MVYAASDARFEARILWTRDWGAEVIGVVETIGAIKAFGAVEAIGAVEAVGV